MNAENFDKVMEQVAEIGYDGVEFYQFYNKSASEVEAVLRSCELEPTSSHVGIDKLRENLDDTLDFHEEIGCDTIIVPYLPAENFESERAIRKTSSELSEIAEQLDDRGFDFGYHNHYHEFFSLDGVTALEAFVEEVSGFVGLQPDIGHIRRAGFVPVSILKKLDSRFASFHIKDVVAREGADIPLKKELTLEEAEKLGEKIKDVRLGDGIVDISDVVKLGEELNVSWFIVEDESSEAPMEAVDIDFRYLDALI